MIFDKKKSVSVILSKMGKDGHTTEVEVKPESGDHDVYSSFAEDMLSAFKDGSIQRLASCLRSFHEMIQEYDEEQDERLEDSEEE